ncbi:hypothetical protein QTH97_32310, partial [Variovorax sp. J22R24]|nr:hypothetical protein [Variovorax sp. J22R24]
MRWLPPALLHVLAMGASAGVGAQPSPEPRRTEEGIPREAMKEPAPRLRDRFFDPQDGQLDLSSFLENPRGFLPIPIVVT